MWRNMCWSPFTFHELWWGGNKSTHTHTWVSFKLKTQCEFVILFNIAWKILTYASVLRLFENFDRQFQISLDKYSPLQQSTSVWVRFGCLSSWSNFSSPRVFHPQHSPFFWNTKSKRTESGLAWVGAHHWWPIRPTWLLDFVLLSLSQCAPHNIA